MALPTGRGWRQRTRSIRPLGEEAAHQRLTPLHCWGLLGDHGQSDCEVESDTQLLWAECDNHCNGQTATLAIAQRGANAGKLEVTATYKRPLGMDNLNNEGFTFAPTRAIRTGTLSCTLPVPTPTPTPTPTPR